MPEATHRPFVLIVRDGWGHNPNPEHDSFNAIKLAETPHGDQLLANYPWTLIHTSGEDVGLPKGTMGNSEVGHQNLGAGRVVNQESVRITKAIRDGQFFENATLIEAIRQAKSNNSCVHLMGIASDAGVHGLLSHLDACLQLCQRQGHHDVAVHLLTDGRDTGPYTGKAFIEQVEDRCKALDVGRIATVCGRYYAMDRDNRWHRVEKAYACLTGMGNPQDQRWATSSVEAIQQYYDQPDSDTQRGDEFVTPTMIGKSLDDCLASRIRDGDTVIFYNYRGDRPRELVKAFTLSDEAWAAMPASPDTGQQGFDRGRRMTLQFVAMTAYEEGLPVKVAFPKLPKMSETTGAYLSDQGVTQFRCAETEKFPHVTFFFNDYREEPFPNETRKMAQSPRVATYDLQPEMSAAEVCGAVIERLQCDRHQQDFILVNFANSDMVGHTGSLQAAIKAVETVDQCVGKIVKATLAAGGSLIVTADHGNAEQMFDPNTKAPHTAHTTYDVECILVTPDPLNRKIRSNGRLADVMPTALELMGLKQPKAMTGCSLLEAVSP